MNFGDLAKQHRIAKNLTLRQFCAELGLDPSNWSKVERGLNPPTGDARTLDAWCKFLGLRGEAKQEFLDAAAVARRQLPEDVAADAELMAKLPAFFRVVRNHDLKGKKLTELVKSIQALNKGGSDS
jgi:transcriptional regulator with XRE-family HTH domain